jgi:hypothetical protein
MLTMSGSDAKFAHDTVAPSSRAGVSLVGDEFTGSFLAEQGESTFPRRFTTKEKLFQKFRCSNAVLSQAVAGAAGCAVG